MRPVGAGYASAWGGGQNRRGMKRRFRSHKQAVVVPDKGGPLDSYGRAAAQVCAAMAIDAEPRLVGWSMVGAYVAGDAFLRVRPREDGNAGERDEHACDTYECGTYECGTYECNTYECGTYEWGQAVSNLEASVLCAQLGIKAMRALVAEPLRAHGHVVEVYQRLWPRLGYGDFVALSPGRVGAHLAMWHKASVDVEWRENQRMRTAERALEKARSRVDDGMVREAWELLDGLRPALEKAPGPRGLLHGDGYGANLLDTSDGLVWVDLDCVGSGPLVVDVAYGAGEMRRFGGAHDVESFVMGYQAAGGPAAGVTFKELASVRDVLGVVDAVSQSWRSAHKANCARVRLETFSQPGVTWEHLAE